MCRRDIESRCGRRWLGSEECDLYRVLYNLSSAVFNRADLAGAQGLREKKNAMVEERDVEDVCRSGLM